MKNRILNIALLFLAGTISALAQRFNFENYSVSSGLPGNHVNTVMQDRLGWLWIGTMNGACKFDGKTFTPFEIGNVLATNPVKSIYQDKAGNIWFGTIRKGAVKYSGTTFTTYTTNEGLLSDIVNAICEDAKGNLWVGTTEGLNRFDGKQFTSYTTSQGLISNTVFDLYTDHKGRLWVATIGGVSMFEGDHFVNFSEAQGLVSNIVYKIKETTDGRIWFSTYEGISVYDGKSFVNYTLDQGLPNDHIEALEVDHAGNVWLGTYGGGLAKFSGDTIQTIRFREGINNNIVKSLIEDKEGNFWVATWNGIFKYNGDRFTTYTIEDGLSNNNILSVFSDREGAVWFGTLAGGVNIFNGSGFSKINTENGLHSNTIWSICQDHSGIYWFGTTNGPARYLKKTGRVDFPYPELDNQIIYAILEDRQHRLFFGTDKGLFVLENGIFSLLSTNEGLSNDKVRVLFEDQQGKIWVGTLKGCFYLDGKRAVSFDEANHLAKAPITSIIQDRYGNILISTYDFGVIRYNPRLQAQPVTLINRKSGLPNDRLLFNYIDSHDNLWLGTPEGVDCIHWAEFLRSGQLELAHYDKSTGFLGVECNAGVEDTKGHLWFATVNGAICYNPSAGELMRAKPLVSLSGIQLFLEDIDWHKNRTKTDPATGLPIDLVLPYNSNHLSFVCNGIYLTAPDEVQYRYMLEGFDEQWSPATKLNISSYSNIPPGSYVFKVQASLNGRDWSVPVTYSFSIRPPIWKTPFFYLLYIVAGVGSIMLAYRIRTRSLRKSQDMLRRKVEARTRELREKNLELAKLSLVASETDNAVMIFDEKLQLEWVNTGYTKLTGFSLEDVRLLRGSSLKDLTTNTDVLSHLDACISARQSFLYESEIHHRDGAIKWASSTLTPIMNESGQLKNVVVIDTDITLRKHMEEQIRAALEEKGVLLREIHHRVKNNLQIIISLFNLQTSYVQDENAYKALKEGQDRIKSMALIHERFYQTDGLSKIDFDEYMRKLSENLLRSAGMGPDKVVLKIQAERISLDIDTAVPCGLIINEIVSNSIKHAFKDGRVGEISIDLQSIENDKYRLTIADNGIGMSTGVTVESMDSLGIQLIQALTDQLEGTMNMESAPGKGVKYTIDFKRIF